MAYCDDGIVAYMALTFVAEGHVAIQCHGSCEAHHPGVLLLDVCVSECCFGYCFVVEDYDVVLQHFSFVMLRCCCCSCWCSSSYSSCYKSESGSFEIFWICSKLRHEFVLQASMLVAGAFDLILVNLPPKQFPPCTINLFFRA